MRIGPELTAVIMGGGGGIGLATARALADRGCGLELVDQRADRLVVATTELAGRARRVRTHVADVGEGAALAALADRLADDGVAPRLLVNCAGVALAGSFAETALADLAWIMRANFLGTAHACHAFLPLLTAHAPAHIVNLGSCFGLVAAAGKSGYAASKFAVHGLTQALRAELRARRIGVSLVCPGPVDTHLVRDGRDPDPAAKAREVAFVAARARAPESVARAILAAVEHDRARVLLGSDRGVDWLARLLPGRAADVLGRLARGLRRT